MSEAPARVAVIGAGYAGLAAAVELSGAGVPVDVLEASRTLGGRARAVEIGGRTLDNGAHILVGAYRETLRLMERVGATPSRCLRRHRLRLEYPGEFSLRAPGLPAPLHLAWALLGARGISFADKAAAIRFMRTMQSCGFRLPADLPAAELLARHRQGPRLRRYLWEPLCLAALNTEVERASAQVFLNVLRDSLAASRAASDLLLPAVDYSRLFPEPAAVWLQGRGSRVLRGRRVESLLQGPGGYVVDGQAYRQVILAVAPYHLPKLVANLPELAAVARTVAGFGWEPIVTAYLRYGPEVRLPFAMVGIGDGYSQWLFDRGPLCGQPGVLASVISAHGRHQDLAHDDLAQRIHGEIARLVPGLAAPEWTRIIVEKRATFACTPGMARPSTETALPGLYLAGDYVAGDYPATIEGAVRSGVRAARSVLDEAAARQP